MRAAAAERRLAAWFVGATAALVALHAAAAATLGFGDAEALYAAYALHPEPTHLDHPDLVGVLGRALAGGAAPTPGLAHAATTVLAALTPLGYALACRAAGATTARALGAGLLLAVTPLAGVGLFAWNPSTLLAPLWIASLGLALFAAREAPGTSRGDAAWLGAGLLAGVATSAHASGATLFVALPLVLASPDVRGHARRAAPWLGLLAGLVVVLPLALHELRAGHPLLGHRLARQLGGRAPGRGLLALSLGQALYLGPSVALFLARRGVAFARGGAAAAPVGARLALRVAAATGLPLAALSLASGAAEPHWIAPALLAVGVAVAATPAPAPRRRAGGPVGEPSFARLAVPTATLTALVHAWVLVPALPALLPERLRRGDVSRELHGWPEVLDALDDEVARAGAGGRAPVVLAPHWTLCAQVHAARPWLLVACRTPGGDDFARWMPEAPLERAARGDAPLVVLTDDHLTDPRAPFLAKLAELHARDVDVTRGGVTIRRFRLATYGAAATAGFITASPASASSRVSSSPSGFGVVSSFSP